MKREEPHQHSHSRMAWRQRAAEHAIGLIAESIRRIAVVKMRTRFTTRWVA
jgi:hypothetical protein